MKILLKGVATAILLLFISLSLLVRFKNIDMTETRLFVEFWYLWIAIFFVAAIWSFLITRNWEG